MGYKLVSFNRSIFKEYERDKEEGTEERKIKKATVRGRARVRVKTCQRERVRGYKSESER